MRYLFFILITSLSESLSYGQFNCIGIKGGVSNYYYNDSFMEYIYYHYSFKAEMNNASSRVEDSPYWIPTGGVWVNYQLTNYLNIQAELSYLNLSLKYSNVVYKGNYEGKHPRFNYNYIFNYISLPIKLKRNFQIKKGGIAFYTGGFINFLLKGKLAYSYDTSSVSIEEREMVENGNYDLYFYENNINRHKIDCGLLFGSIFYYEFNNKILLQLDGGFAIGFIKAATVYSNELQKSYYIKHYPGFLTIGLGYKL